MDPRARLPQLPVNVCRTLTPLPHLLDLWAWGQEKFSWCEVLRQHHNSCHHVYDHNTQPWIFISDILVSQTMWSVIVVISHSSLNITKMSHDSCIALKQKHIFRKRAHNDLNAQKNDSVITHKHVSLSPRRLFFCPHVFVCLSAGLCENYQIDSTKFGGWMGHGPFQYIFTWTGTKGQTPLKNEIKGLILLYMFIYILEYFITFFNIVSFLTFSQILLTNR